MIYVEYFHIVIILLVIKEAFHHLKKKKSGPLIKLGFLCSTEIAQYYWIWCHNIREGYKTDDKYKMRFCKTDSFLCPFYIFFCNYSSS